MIRNAKRKQEKKLAEGGGKDSRVNTQQAILHLLEAENKDRPLAH